MDFDFVINNISNFITNEMYGTLSEWTEQLACKRVVRAINRSKFKEMLENGNGFLNLAILDDNGNIDIDGFYEDLKDIVKKKGVIELNIPVLGNFKLKETDIDRLYKYAKGEL